MVNVENIGKTDGYVYDISLDGTVVNALGMNVMHNTDGWNFCLPDTFRYTEESPYISNGLGRNTEKGKAYVGLYADVAEFEDTFLHYAYNGGINKCGLAVDEVIPANFNISRKNYADLLDDGKVKKVGNTIKSRKMAGYLERFIDKAVELLLHEKGYEFIEYYYDYIDKLSNYNIPVKDIASKGKIKKSVADYIADCSLTNKNGSKKSRQAWYELAIKNNLKVDMGDTITYINTGAKKGDSDVKRVTHKYVIDKDGNEVLLKGKVKSETIKDECEKRGIEYKTLTTKEKKEILDSRIVREEDEIILNCKIVPDEIMESSDEILCSQIEDFEYNVDKYIEQFNKRIKPLLVCFSVDIRDRVIVTNPKERNFFTEKECQLVSGYPFKQIDQDPVEVMMIPERKEIEFWLKIGERPPFVEECGIEWDKLVSEYLEKKKEEDTILFEEENAKYLKALSEITSDERENFESDGVIPSRFEGIVTMDSDLKFYFDKIPHMTPSTGGNVIEDILSYEDITADNSDEVAESVTISSSIE